jgi:hypothetical protein
MSPAQAVENEPITVKAGYGEADATWHVGAGAGQYSEKNPDNVINSVGNGDVDPHGHSIVQKDSYGVQSRLSYRAIVTQDADGDQVAFVKSDSYLAQDYLSRRVGQILQLAGSDISYDEIFLMASHNHSSPYYMTPSWGVWIFQDAFDIRAFEYHARAMAQAILNAENALVPARMGATSIDHHLFKGMIARKGLADDGTPKGYPDDFGDLGLSVVRFDDMTDPTDPKPLASLVNWGQHPESLDNHDLITGDFVASLERYVERDTGAPVVFGQGDVGSAEAGPGRPQEVADLGIPARWSHAGHAQAERGGFLLSRDVVEAWDAIGAHTPVPGYESTFVEFSSDFDVEAGNAWTPGPYSQPYPGVSNCRTEPTAKGNPGVPVAGLPDCERPGLEPHGPFAELWNLLRDNGFPLPEEGETGPVWDAYNTLYNAAFSTTGELYDELKANGVPIPEQYNASAFTGVEENLRLHLQAFKMGEVILMSCSCEAQVDLILNLESRTNETQDDMWEGFDWTTRMDCTQESLPQSDDWTCRPRPGDQRAVLGPHTFTNDEYLRMRAEIHKPADGWDAPENALFANAEPDNPDDPHFWGNFTHSELPAQFGYKLPIGVGHAGDYNGYTVSYREYMSYDHYRKALTSYGPHTADYMNTRLARLAGELNGQTHELDPVEEADKVRALADEARQVAMSTALGAVSFAAYEAWTASLPPDKGPAAAIAEPSDVIKRFEATTFTWRGGSNAVDNPVVKVQRETGPNRWTDFADQSGEVQTMLHFPKGVNAFASTYSGQQEWLWTANFEAFDAFPLEIGSTPEGTYRFVVEGKIKDAPGEAPSSYEITSDSFEVKPWDGLKVQNFNRNPDGTVSYDVAAIRYPKSYTSPFPYVKSSGKTPQGDDVLKNDDLGKEFCTTCSFRPWATGGQLQVAEVTAVDGAGHSTNLEMTCVPDHQEKPNEPTAYSCSSVEPVPADSTVAVYPGDVQDLYGETTATCVSPDEGADCPPDGDDDGTIDDNDNCPAIPNNQTDVDGDGIGDACDDRDDRPADADQDGITDAEDNCPAIANADQADADSDHAGDACDETPNGDDNGEDNDADDDGVSDAADNCPAVANQGQADADGDGDGDACDDTPTGPPADGDGDGATDADDNCPGVANSGQSDSDQDGSGDACDATPNGEGGNGGNSGGNGGGGSESSPPAATETPAGHEIGSASTSISADATKITYGRAFTLAGAVSGDRGCAPSSVEILGRTYGADSFESVGTIPVGPDGSWSTSIEPTHSTSYSARPVGSPTCESVASTAVDVLVRARITVAAVGCSSAARVRGDVAPAYPGSTIQLQVKTRRGWRTIGTDELDGRSRFAFRVDSCRSLRVTWASPDVRNASASARVEVAV